MTSLKSTLNLSRDEVLEAMKSVDSFRDFLKSYEINDLKFWKEDSKHKHSLLHLAVLSNQPAILEILVKDFNFNVNVQRESDKCTPLHLARFKKLKEISELLISLGADVDVLNSYGEKADTEYEIYLNRIAWLDLELTNLENPEILEIAIVITEGDDLSEVARKRWVLSCEDLSKLSAFSKDTFAENGLLDEIKGSTLKTHECEEQVLAFLKEHCALARMIPIGGCSVHCDREILKTTMPSVYQFISHQVIDVSTVVSLIRRWDSSLYDKLDLFRNSDAPKYTHRAEADCDFAISLCKWMKGNAFKLSS